MDEETDILEPEAIEEDQGDLTDDDSEEVEEFGEADEVDEAAEDEAKEAELEADGELVVEIASEEPAEDEPTAIVSMRERIRELKRENRELRESAPQEKPIEVGPEPTLEQFDYDATKFKAALLDWNERRRAVEAQEAQQRSELEAAQADYAKRLSSYQQGKGRLGVKDFDAAESAVMEDFTQAQQSVIVKAAGNPALLVYALGKNEGARQKLAAEKDPISFAYQLATLEAKMAVRNTSKPKPERKVRGASGKPPTNLEALERKAEETGDFSALFAARRKLKKGKG